MKNIEKIIICILLISSLYLMLATYKNKLKGEVSMENRNIIDNNLEDINNKKNTNLEHLFFIKSKEDFKKGKLDDVIVGEDSETIGNVILASYKGKYAAKGTYTSEEINIEKLKKLIVSWNAKTPEKTYIEIEARVYCTNVNDKNSGMWSQWLSWGKWGRNIRRESVSNYCDVAQIDTDTFIIKDNMYGSKFQVRATLYTSDLSISPILNQITIAYVNEDDIVVEVFNENIVDKVIETPKISQMTREESIAKKICSPTSMTMLLNRLGENLIVEDVAWDCFDYNYDGFGNWAYNVAFAGSLGYESYIEYGSLKSLKREIDNGYPVAVSVKYTNDISNKTYTFIENAPLTTSGHLIVVCGFISENGNKYVVVNDPAAKDDESVRLKYKLEDFMKAWSSSNYVMYIVH